MSVEPCCPITPLQVTQSIPTSEVYNGAGSGFQKPDNPAVASDSDRDCDFLLFPDPDQDPDSILDYNQRF